MLFGNCPSANGSKPGEIRSVKPSDALRVYATKRVNRKRGKSCHRPGSQMPQNRALPMTLGRKHGREQYRVGMRRARPDAAPQRMCGAGDEPVRTARTPLRGLGYGALGEMHAIGAALRGERRIVGNRPSQRARACKAGQHFRKFRADRAIA